MPGGQHLDLHPAAPDPPGKPEGPGIQRAVQSLPAQPAGVPVRLPNWATHLLGILTIASGLLAAFVAFNAQYLQNNKPWSSSVYLGFIGSVTSAFIVGATAGRLAQNVYQKPPDKPPEPGR